MNNSYFSIEFQSKDEKNLLTLLLTVFVACYGLSILFLACELSQRLGNAFTEIDRMIEQFDWYLFPLNIRRMLPIIIAVAQEPVNLECFGSISCNRAVFQKVCIVVHMKNDDDKTTFFLVSGIIFRLSIPLSHTLWCSVKSANEVVYFKFSAIKDHCFENFSKFFIWWMIK